MDSATADQAKDWSSEPAHVGSADLLLQASAILAVYFDVVVHIEKVFFENVLAFFFVLANSALVNTVLQFANVMNFFSKAFLLMCGHLPFMFEYL